MTHTTAPTSLLGRALQRRRIRIWAVTVTLIVALLLLEIFFPDMRTLSRVASDLTAPVLLAVFMAALCCEFIDSSLGMGYGTTLTPLLLLCGFSPLQVVPCILISELMTGLTAGLMHHRDGNVDFVRDRQARETTLLLSLLSAVGASTAVFIALRIPKVWLNGIIAVIILSVGITILATIRHQFQYRRRHIVLVGAVAAFNKGLSGGGYGPLVTAGQVVSGLSPKQAVAITSLSESLTCLVGLIAYVVLKPGALDLSLAPPMVIGALLSVPLATLTVRRLPEGLMRTGVGVTTCLLGLITLCKLL